MHAYRECVNLPAARCNLLQEASLGGVVADGCADPESGLVTSMRGALLAQIAFCVREQLVIRERVLFGSAKR